MKLNQLRNQLTGFPSAAPASATPHCLIPFSAVVKRRLPGLPTYLLLLLLLVLPAVVQAQFTYTTNNGTITITGYTDPGGDVTIPDTITGLPVTRIGDSAFSPGFAGTLGLTSVTIGNSVSSIGAYAFAFCASLTSVTIGTGVSSIADTAFEACDSLTGIEVVALNPIYSSVDGVLFNHSQTTLILCPEGKSGSYTIPNSVTSIGDSAFYSCSSLTKVTVGNGVTNIRFGTFQYCYSLTGVYFKGNPPSNTGYVFHGDDNVTVYYLPGTSGWGTTYDFRPTALWKPLVQTSDASFGVRTNQFGFNVTWASGMVVVVEASTNLASPTWSPLQTNTLSSDSLYFSDPQWTNYPNRFYRLRSP